MTFSWDELNVIRSKIELLELESAKEPGKKKYDPEKCVDIVYEWLEYAWTMGVMDTNEELSTSYAVNESDMRSEIHRKIAGKDYAERVREWAEKGDLDAIIRVAETDATRLVNEASFDTAEKAGMRYKTWITMQDDKVRDTHVFLHGMKIPINDYFVTFDGDRAKKPGQFSKAENNVNCRCKLKYTYD